VDRYLRFEKRRDKVVPSGPFLRRLGRNLLVALGMLAVSLIIGVTGYALFEGKNLVDAYDNAAMILSGMGPFTMAETTAGRIFEGTYALYSGIVVVLVSGLILAPVFHRVLHSFHVEDDDDEKRAEKRQTRR
jgi:hypothetical protein